MTPDENPLTRLDPAHTMVPAARWARIITQLQFSPALTADTVDQLCNDLQRLYPQLRAEPNAQLVLDPEEGIRTDMETIWRLTTPDGPWRASLTPNFLALETADRQELDDLWRRWLETLEAATEHLASARISRLGVRLISRTTDPARVGSLTTWLRPEIVGVGGAPVAAQAQHTFAGGLFDLPGERGQLMAAWGLVPPHATTDPSVWDPLDVPCWMFDLDASTTQLESTDPGTLVVKTRSLAARALAFFAWATQHRPDPEEVLDETA